MENNHINIIQFFILAALVLTACSRADVMKPLGEQTAPAQITVRDVVNGPGNAILYYDLPDDENLKYVKAVYSPRDGEEVFLNASAFTDSLVLDGFKDAGTFDVKLYSVSFGEVYSDPVNVKVSPLTPPYKVIASGLSCTRTFGGVYVSFDNPTNASLAVCAYKRDEAGNWQEITTYYTSSENVKVSVRGQDAVETTFRFSVEDQWGDVAYSDEFTVTPWFEVLCDKSLFKALKPAGDNWTIHMWGGASNRNSLESAWDGTPDPARTYDRGAPLFQTSPYNSLPMSFTIDLGRMYQLSRFKYYACQGFRAGHPRTFQIYGATELNPDPTVVLIDALGNQDPYWTLLRDCESFRPSGATVSGDEVPRTAEDDLLLAQGEEWEFPSDIPAVRYLRIRVQRTWGGAQYIECCEIDVYGTPIEE